MIKKKFAFIAIALILVVAASAGAISYAAWDADKPKTEVEFDTGANTDVTVHDVDFKENKILVPNGKSMMQKNEAIEVTISSFRLSLENFTAAEYSIVSIGMFNPKDDSVAEIDATSFMEVTLVDVTSANAAYPLSKGDKLSNDQIINVKLRFTVDSSSDKLTTNMANLSVRVKIKITGVITNV